MITLDLSQIRAQLRAESQAPPAPRGPLGALKKLLGAPEQPSLFTAPPAYDQAPRPPEPSREAEGEGLQRDVIRACDIPGAYRPRDHRAHGHVEALASREGHLHVRLRNAEARERPRAERACPDQVHKLVGRI